MIITMTGQSSEGHFRLYVSFQNSRAVHDPSVTKDARGYIDAEPSPAPASVHCAYNWHLPNLAAGLLWKASRLFYNDISEVLRFHSFNLIDIGELHHASGSFKSRHYRHCEECLG
jgi:hypothetical protein